MLQQRDQFAKTLAIPAIDLVDDRERTIFIRTCSQTKQIEEAVFELQGELTRATAMGPEPFDEIFRSCLNDGKW